ncbi:MAG: hypothetical protein HOH66_09900 [Rhodospirillaceae bacterium]|mgnify:CR=1 FL=1|nr:hypothetical protein [Rhodospirillaceae bacterium]MBT6118166.1 hypothetical protein [Rhodospirillaceae bacterium]
MAGPLDRQLDTVIAGKIDRRDDVLRALGGYIRAVQLVLNMDQRRNQRDSDLDQTGLSTSDQELYGHLMQRLQRTGNEGNASIENAKSDEENKDD